MISFRIPTCFTFSGDGLNVRSVFKFSAVLFGSAQYMLCSENSLRFGLWFILEFSPQKSLLCFGEDIPHTISSGTIPRLTSMSLHTQYLETHFCSLVLLGLLPYFQIPRGAFCQYTQLGRQSLFRYLAPYPIMFCSSV